MSSAAAGWQPDPTGRHEHRYWDGTGWTDNVADGGVGSSDPMTASADDPTIAQPGIGGPTATQPTIGDPTTPGVPVPPTAWPPASTPPPAGPVGSDGSRRNLWIGVGVLGAVAIAVIAFLVLGGDDDDSGQEAADRTDVAEDAGEDGEPDASSGDDGEDSTDDSEGFDEPLGDVGDLPEFDPEDPEAYLAALYKDMFGLSDEQAECLASELAPLMDTPDPSLTPDVGEMMDMFERCDIDPSDLGGFSDG